MVNADLIKIIYQKLHFHNLFTMYKNRRRIFIPHQNTAYSIWKRNGGDEEDRTPDLLNANQALSQLSYVPIKEWWAWQDLNLRPHAYQACALTN